MAAVPEREGAESEDMKRFDWPAEKTSCGDNFVWMRLDHASAYVNACNKIAEFCSVHPSHRQI